MVQLMSYCIVAGSPASCVCQTHCYPSYTLCLVFGIGPMLSHDRVRGPDQDAVLKHSPDRLQSLLGHQLV